MRSKSEVNLKDLKKIDNSIDYLNRLVAGGNCQGRQVNMQLNDLFCLVRKINQQQKKGGFHPTDSQFLSQIENIEKVHRRNFSSSLSEVQTIQCLVLLNHARKHNTNK